MGIFHEKIYHRRFIEDKYYAVNSDNTWDILVKKVFQKYIHSSATVLDLGTGTGKFIMRVNAMKKHAVDINSNLSDYFSGTDVKFYKSSSASLPMIEDNSHDVVFTSNMLEHLRNYEELFATLQEAFRILKKNRNSTLIIMIPNGNKVGSKFYDFIDHTLNLTDKSLIEALEIENFTIVESIPGFLPYTAQNVRFKVPKWLINFYILLPIRNRPFAGQMLLIAKIETNYTESAE